MVYRSAMKLEHDLFLIVFLMSGGRGRAMVFSYQSIPLGDFHRSVYYDMYHHCHIALQDPVVGIVFVAWPPFIFFIHVTLDHWTSRYTTGGIHIESYLCSSIEL